MGTQTEIQQELKRLAHEQAEEIEAAYKNGTLDEWFNDVYETYKIYSRTFDYKLNITSYKLLTAWGNPNTLIIDDGSRQAYSIANWCFDTSERVLLSVEATDELFDIVDEVTEMEYNTRNNRLY